MWSTESGPPSFPIRVRYLMWYPWEETICRTKTGNSCVCRWVQGLWCSPESGSSSCGSVKTCLKAILTVTSWVKAVNSSFVLSATWEILQFHVDMGFSSYCLALLSLQSQHFFLGWFSIDFFSHFIFLLDYLESFEVCFYGAPLLVYHWPISLGFSSSKPFKCFESDEGSSL